MKTEHTKGPWEIETKGSRHFIDGADQLTVAYVDRAGVRDRQEIEANARLIAVAPELLEALYAALPCVEESEEFDKPNGPKLSVKIRALLAQAEGNA